METPIEIVTAQLGQLLDEMLYHVVEAADPTNVITPLPLKLDEAEALANTMINDTCADWLVVKVER